MNWINIKEEGQPKNSGWYLVFNGEEWEKALYKNYKWYLDQHDRNKPVIYGKSRVVITEYVTHYLIVNELKTN